MGNICHKVVAERLDAPQLLYHPVEIVGQFPQFPERFSGLHLYCEVTFRHLLRGLADIAQRDQHLEP